MSAPRHVYQSQPEDAPWSSTTYALGTTWTSLPNVQVSVMVPWVPYPLAGVRLS